MTGPNSLKVILIIPVLAGLTVACTIKHNAFGRYTDGSETFYGGVEHDIMFGGGRFHIQSTSSDVTCDGTANLDELKMDCTGQTGKIDMSCSDGRTFVGSYTVTSCTSGVGEASDQHGMYAEFVFGLSDRELADALGR